jgi:hypothetical protein
MKHTWMGRKITDKNKVAYLKKCGIEPYRIDGKGYYYFNAQETDKKQNY